MQQELFLLVLRKTKSAIDQCLLFLSGMEMTLTKPAHYFVGSTLLVSERETKKNGYASSSHEAA